MADDVTSLIIIYDERTHEVIVEIRHEVLPWCLSPPPPPRLSFKAFLCFVDYDRDKFLHTLGGGDLLKYGLRNTHVKRRLDRYVEGWLDITTTIIDWLNIQYSACGTLFRFSTFRVVFGFFIV